MPNKKYLLLFLFITIISIFPRAIEIFNQSNYYFGSEQATEYLVTKSIVVNHQVVLTAHQGGFGGFSKTPGFNYLLIIPFIIGNGDPFAGRIFMFIISVLTVLLAFVFANRMFGLKTASLIGFLLAISPSLKDYAQSVSPPFIIPLLTVFFIYFLFEIFKGKKNIIPLLVFTVGIMANFEMATAVILMALLMLTAIICIIKKTIPYRYYFISFFLLLLTLLPIIVFDIFNNFSNIKGVIKIIQVGGNHTTNNLILNIGNIINSRIPVFSWNFISTFSSNPIIWLTLFFVILFGTIIFIKDKKINIKKRQFSLYLGFIPIFAFVFILFYPDKTVQQWWLLDLTVIYCFLLGIIMEYFWKKNIHKFIILIVIIILSLAFLKRTIFLYQTQFAYPPNIYIKEAVAINYVFNYANKKPFGIQVFSKGSQENYDYLIWWYGQKYNYQPSQKLKDTYFVIIEPNLSFSIKKSPGKLIETKQLGNGFIVKKIIN